MVPRIQHIIEDNVEKKRCGKCCTYKSIELFNYCKQSWDKLRITCKECLEQERKENKDKITEYNKKYWQETQEEQKKKNKEWREKNKEHIKEKMTEWLEKNKEHKKKKDKECRGAHREKYRENMRIWRKKNYQDLKTNPDRKEEYIKYKLKSNTGRRIREILTQKKSQRVKEYVGCSFDELKTHLSLKFQKGMTWDNYGSEWHIDHIIPCTAFNFLDDIEAKACFYYKNLQPLWGPENIKKNNIYNIDDKLKYLEEYKKIIAI
jgi:hypothetical protein